MEGVKTREQLLLMHKSLCDAARDLMQKKNSDYGANTDPFRNFHTFGAFGILVRESDKLSRLRTFLEKLEKGEDMAVADESWTDTCIDAINYIVLFYGYVATYGAGFNGKSGK